MTAAPAAAMDRKNDGKRLFRFGISNIGEKARPMNLTVNDIFKIDALGGWFPLADRQPVLG